MSTKCNYRNGIFSHRWTHSTLRFGTTCARTDLSGNSLAKLPLKLANKHYIIVDEVSMLGQNTMEWVDRRLKQASRHKDIPFGIILIGDFAQLLPIGDRVLYSHPPDGIESHGHTVYKLFTSVIILKEVVR